jgi:hypothetical protein
MAVSKELPARQYFISEIPYPKPIHDDNLPPFGPTGRKRRRQIAAFPALILRSDDAAGSAACHVSGELRLMSGAGR